MVVSGRWARAAWAASSRRLNRKKRWQIFSIKGSKEGTEAGAAAAQRYQNAKTEALGGAVGG
ncbi:hypothetical protein GCM10028821_32670 [Hymenobacter jeollabukensis]